MLGSAFFKMLSGNKDFEMYAFDKDLDISDSEALEQTLAEIDPDFVINCAAFTAVDECETDSDNCMKVNGTAPGVIAKACKKHDAIFVHISTDYVFDGNNLVGYKEDDPTGPINKYGESKLLGENEVMANCDEYYIVRTSWLFGENGKNFVDTMVKLGNEKEELNVVSDQTGIPTYTNDLVKAVVNNFLGPFLSHLPEHHKRNIKENDQPSKKLPFGIYHLTNTGPVCWCEFAKEIFKQMKMDVKVNHIGSAEYKRPARRPEYSVLLNTKLPENLRDWREALKAYLDLS